MLIGLNEDETVEVLKRFLFFNVGEYHNKSGEYLKERIRAETSITEPYLDTSRVVIPGKVLAELLVRSYSTVRIRLEPVPVEVYVTEMETEVKGRIHRDWLEICNKVPKIPNFCTFDNPWRAPKGQLKSYLCNVDSSGVDPFLDLFAKEGEDDVEKVEGGARFYFKGEPSFKVTDGREENRIPFHSHAVRPLCPSRTDLENDFRFMGLVFVDGPGFAGFVLGRKIPAKDLILKRYKRGDKCLTGSFLSVKATHRLAEEYVRDRIMEDLCGYVKRIGCPVLIWERDEKLPRKFSNDYRNRFFVNYEVSG